MLLEWWNGGIKQPKTIMIFLQQQGYNGSERTVSRYVRQLRAAQGLPPTRVVAPKGLPKVIDPQLPPLTARRMSYLILKREENRTPEEQELLGYVNSEYPDLAMAVDLANGFLSLLRQQQADDFDDWLTKSFKSLLKPFQSFANGLMSDYEAVKLSMMSRVSNGPVEGLNNRLKMLKRQMYGRAGLELLSKRFILAQ